MKMVAILEYNADINISYQHSYIHKNGTSWLKKQLSGLTLELTLYAQ